MILNSWGRQDGAGGAGGRAFQNKEMAFAKNKTKQNKAQESVACTRIPSWQGWGGWDGVRGEKLRQDKLQGEAT